MLVGVLQLLVEPSQRWMIGRCGQCGFDIIRSGSFEFVVASLCRGHGSQYIKSSNISTLVRGSRSQFFSALRAGEYDVVELGAMI